MALVLCCRARVSCCPQSRLRVHRWDTGQSGQQVHDMIGKKQSVGAADLMCQTTPRRAVRQWCAADDGDHFAWLTPHWRFVCPS
jgi:hypothetical protein